MINVFRIVERLKLCQRFFPAFQQVISEIQEFLGEIVTAYSLTYYTPSPNMFTQEMQQCMCHIILRLNSNCVDIL